MLKSGTRAPTRHISRSSMAWTWLPESRPTEAGYGLVSIWGRERSRTGAKCCQCRRRESKILEEDKLWRITSTFRGLDSGLSWICVRWAFEWEGKLKAKFECRAGASSALHSRRSRVKTLLVSLYVNSRKSKNSPAFAKSNISTNKSFSLHFTTWWAGCNLSPHKGIHCTNNQGKRVSIIRIKNFSAMITSPLRVYPGAWDAQFW
jgi:hypothetical protein